MAKFPSEARLAFPARSLRHVWQTIKENSLSVGIAFLLIWIVGAPVVTLIVSSLRQGDFISPGPFTLDNYRTVFLGAQTYPALINTLIYAGVVSAISLTLATVFAWLVERTDMPGKNWAWTMMLIPLAIRCSTICSCVDSPAASRSVTAATSASASKIAPAVR